jgi:H+/Na+-translocating ferredoxin:NAD+ oxidoreductase subunit B
VNAVSVDVLAPTLASRLDALLPQTQCTRCGYPDCRAYADAIAVGRAEINQCPPGGEEGVRRLAELTGRPALPLNPDNGREGPRLLALIDEAACIGCTLCLKACPVDCIVGGPKAMHTVIESLCTGCELCIPACPVDCISLHNASGERTGWAAWSEHDALLARTRYRWHASRLERDQRENVQRLAEKAPDAASAATSDPKRDAIQAALARARARRPA